MAGYLREAKNLVNTPAVDIRQTPGYTGDVRTLADRIRYLVKLRGVDQRTFAREAGLSSSYISVFLSSAKDNPEVGMGSTRLDAIARTWGADPQWLLHGVGTPPSKSFDGPTRQVRPTKVTAVVREEPAEPAGSEDGNPLQKALGAAFDAGKHTVADLRRVDDLMGDFDMELAEADLVAVARRWLDAAAAMRREGVVFSPQAMIVRLAAGANSEAAVRASDRRAGEQLKALDAMVPRAPMDDVDDAPGSPPAAPLAHKPRR